MSAAPALSYSHASGTLFPLGTTTVIVTATDAAGNSGSASFSVTVRDTTAPTVTPPANVTAAATSASGAVVIYPLATASDAVDPAPVVSCTPASGSLFPLGISTVTCTVTDASGNSASATFTVIVADSTPPVTTLSVSDLDGDGALDAALITLSASDTITGVASISYALDGALPTTVAGGSTSLTFPAGSHRDRKSVV